MGDRPHGLLAVTPQMPQPLASITVPTANEASTKLSLLCRQPLTFQEFAIPLSNK